MMASFNMVMILCVLQAASLLEGAGDGKKRVLDVELNGLKKCQKELNTPESYVQDIFMNLIVPPDSGCLVRCTMKEMNWLTQDGAPDLDKILRDIALIFDDAHFKHVERYYKECYPSMPKGPSKCDGPRYLLDCVFNKTYHSGLSEVPHPNEGL